MSSFKNEHISRLNVACSFKSYNIIIIIIIQKRTKTNLLSIGFTFSSKFNKQLSLSVNPETIFENSIKFVSTVSLSKSGLSTNEAVSLE